MILDPTLPSARAVNRGKIACPESVALHCESAKSLHCL